MSARPAWGVVPFLLSVAVASTCTPTPDVPGSASDSSAIELVDAEGRTVRIPAHATRIVSLVPSATLTLQALGAAAQVVARTDFDTVAWALDLPSVGGGLEPSMEAIVAARPDLVIRFGGPQDPRTPSLLDDLAIPHIAIRPDRIDDVLEEIHLLGAATGHVDAARAITATIRDTLDAVRTRNADKPPVRVAYVLGGTPPWVAGPDTYIDDLIRLAGGVNVFSDLDRPFGSVSPEEFVARQIDVVMTPLGTRFEQRLAPSARQVQATPVMELPGPGVGAAAREMERALRPGGES